MAEVVKAPLESGRVAGWTRQRRALLFCLLAVALGGLAFRVVWDRLRARELATLSTSDLRILTQQQPNNFDAHIRLAERYLWEERNEDALRAAGQAVKLAPRSAHVYYLLGKAYQRLSEPDAGVNALKEAVRLDPGHAPAQFLLGHAYYWHEQPLLAAQQFDKYVDLQPADDIGFRFLGLARLRLGNMAGAEPALRRAVELGPDSSGNRQALGNFFLGRAQSQEDLELAAAELLRAVLLNPRVDSNRIQAAIALERLNRLEEAASHYEAVLARSPTDERVCYALLQIYTRLKDTSRIARYRQLYRRIVRAREASNAITANKPGEPSYPTR